MSDPAAPRFTLEEWLEKLSDEEHACSIRLECLREAHKLFGDTNAIVDRARAYASFVLGAAPPPTARAQRPVQ